MSRYIDADKLQRHGNRGGVVYWRDIEAQPTADVVKVDKAQKEIDYWHDKAQSYEQTILKLSLNKADVVEVVRCKDCKYRDTMPEYEYDDDHEHRTLMGTDFCRWWHDESPNDDDYCSYGERKEG